MPVLSARRSSLVGEVVDRLRALIEDDNLSAGDRLPTEAQLMGKLEVSRTVLREAVGKLEMLGLISVRHGQGMFVGDRDGLAQCAQLARSALTISDRDPKHFGDLRCAIEFHAVRRAAERATPEQIAELEVLLDGISRDDQTFEQALVVDFAFHRKLVEIAGNPLSLSLFTVLQQFVLIAMKKISKKPRDHRAMDEVHRPIFEGVRRHDPDAAEAAMRKHMDYWTERLAELNEL